MSSRIAIVVAAAITVIAVAPASAYYEEEGFFVFLDAALANPLGTAQIVGYETTNVNPEVPISGAPIQSTTEIKPDWGASAAGRIGFGYRWSA